MSFDERGHNEERSLRFFATAPRPCSYLENRSAVSIFADPDATLDQGIYNQLVRYGFRRSGKDLYVPSCPGCTKCIPVRTAVMQFSPSKSQQRIWKRNQDLTWKSLPAKFHPEHFVLYSKYLASRHAGGGMEDPTQEEYMSFLSSNWSDTSFLEARLDNQLVAVAVTDHLNDGLSSVYSFFDPNLARRSLGTFCVLYQLQMAAELGKDWLYLGYWIQESQKMSYKSRFKPIQMFRDGQWQTLNLDRA